MLVGTGGLVVARPITTQIIGFDITDIGIILAGLGMAAWLLFTLRSSDDEQPRHWGRMISLAIFFAMLAGGFAYREPLVTIAQNTFATAPPPRTDAASNVPRSVLIRRQDGGHFVVTAKVESRDVKMLVDTGASILMLRSNDAAAAGFDVNRLEYSEAVQTANGTTYAARVVLRDVSVGVIRLHDVEALVARPGALPASLLGMSFLSRLRSHSVSGDFLTLRS
jgi:aspartyl protease family protein